MIRVQLDTSPLNNLNATRGVGMYTELLKKYISKRNDVLVLDENSQDEPDIVHYPFFDLFFRTLPIRKKTRTIVTIHDVIPLLFPEQYPPGIRGKVKLELQKLSLHTVDAIITDSLCSKKDIIQFLHIPEHKVHAILLAGNPSITQQPLVIIENMKKKYNLPQHYLLYIGDINYNKNLPGLIQAFSSLPNEYSLVLVGRNFNNTSIPEGEVLHKKISDLQLNDRVVCLTNVPKEPYEDMSAILSGAIAYIQPSLYEGFGLPILDAMQCGTVVVSSNRSSLPEVASDAALYFDPENVQDMKTTLQRAISLSLEERSGYINKGFENVKRFSWEKTAAETIELYYKVSGLKQ